MSIVTIIVVIKGLLGYHEQGLTSNILFAMRHRVRKIEP